MRRCAARCLRISCVPGTSAARRSATGSGSLPMDGRKIDWSVSPARAWRPAIPIGLPARSIPSCCLSRLPCWCCATVSRERRENVRRFALLPRIAAPESGKRFTTPFAPLSRRTREGTECREAVHEAQPPFLAWNYPSLSKKSSAFTILIPSTSLMRSQSMAITIFS